MNRDILVGKMTGCDLDYRHSLTNGNKEDCLFATGSKQAASYPIGTGDNFYES
jgi:hypothetical protein